MTQTPDDGGIERAAPRRPARRKALRRTAARRARPPQHQRELLPRPAVRRGRDHRRGRRGGGRPEPLPRPGVHRAADCPRGIPLVVGDLRRRRRRSGPATAPTRCCSTWCWPSAGPGARPWASPPPTRCTRSSAARSARTWVDGLRGAGRHALRPDRRVRGRPGARARPPRRLPLLTEQPDRHRPGARRRRGRVCRGGACRRRRRRGLRGVRPPRDAERPDPARGPPAARRHPHDEQGVRLRGRAARATSPPTRPWSTRSDWCGCPTTCPPPPRRSRWRRCGTRPRCSRPSRSIKEQRDRIVAELAAARARPGRQRRQLRPVRRSRRRRADLAGAAGPGSTGPRRRHPPLSSCHGRDPGRDRCVPRRHGAGRPT